MTSTKLQPYDTRNVVDHFKYWNNEAITAQLDCTCAPMSVAMEHWTHDLNIGGFVRNANAFNACELFYIGKRQWDRRGAVGTHHYKRLQHLKKIQEFIDIVDSRGYTLFAIDNVDGAKPINKVKLPKRSMFLFGEEATGVSQAGLDAATDVLYIEQYGSVRSLNASTASGIAMYEWSRQHR